MQKRPAPQTLAIGFALFVCPGESGAAMLTYDVAGTSAELTRSGDPLDPDEPSPREYVSTPFAPGSSLTLEFDANVDGVSGDVTVSASRFLLQATHSLLSGTFNITTDFVAELSGGLGALDPLFGNLLEWSDPASYSVAGIFRCLGPSSSFAGLAEGVEYPYSDFHRLFLGSVEFLKAVPLGIWRLNQGAPGNLDFVCVPLDNHICDWPISTAVTTNAPSEWWVGLDLHGRAVPEPNAALLGAAGLLALALRRRRSDTMRRHEVA